MTGLDVVLGGAVDRVPGVGRAGQENLVEPGGELGVEGVGELYFGRDGADR